MGMRTEPVAESDQISLTPEELIEELQRVISDQVMQMAAMNILIRKLRDSQSDGVIFRERSNGKPSVSVKES